MLENEKLSDDKFLELVKGDPEAITLFKKVGGPHSPLTFDDLPYDKSGTINSNLHRLFEFHKQGWFNIVDIHNTNNCTLKQFKISEKGKEFFKLI